jgi:hypothetical protein
VDRIGLCEAAPPCVDAALVFAAGAPVPLAAGPVVLGPAGSAAAAGPTGSGFMMLTGGIDAAEGKNISGRKGRPGEGRLPFGFDGEGLEEPATC